MCGITVLLKYYKEQYDIKEISSIQKHRGGDHQGIERTEKVDLGFERLAIEDLSEAGHQPFLSNDKEIILIHNGEIYNYKMLIKKYQLKVRSSSDSEVILKLYEHFEGDIEKVLKVIDGMYAFSILDKGRKSLILARDPFGIKPLHYVAKKDGIAAASELKVIAKMAKGMEIKRFKPGHFIKIDTEKEIECKKGELLGCVQFYKPKWFDTRETFRYHSEEVAQSHIRTLLIEAVQKRIPSIPYGVFLSGGLDSSLVAGIATALTRTSIPSFSVGLSKIEDGKRVPLSPDIENARIVAKYLKTDHHEILYTVEEGLKTLKDVIYAAETFDVTTIRSSTPMLMLAREARKYVRTVLAGEGADEVFCGYAYFSCASSDEELHKESVKKVRDLHTADVQRVDRTSSYRTLECRVPFMDQDLIDYAMTKIDPADKRFKIGSKMEKLILRKAFEDDDFIPREILFRSKIQLSDGVGSLWIDSLKEFAEGQISDEQMAKAKERWPIEPPTTKEGYLYRDYFAEIFPGQDQFPTLWKPFSKLVDPSGRFQVEELTK
mmetsp:Transcript_12663/g.19015  ORF Transcript_12663/g.19015 Transcript_12663/m.19015 type:complete len:548 (+) Transcript_12663:21-1664(+)